jgi:hypothetical protein
MHGAASHEVAQEQERALGGGWAASASLSGYESAPLRSSSRGARVAEKAGAALPARSGGCPLVLPPNRRRLLPPPPSAATAEKAAHSQETARGAFPPAASTDLNGASQVPSPLGFFADNGRVETARVRGGDLRRQSICSTRPPLAALVRAHSLLRRGA